MRKMTFAVVGLAFIGLVGCQSKENTSLKIYVQQKLYDKAIQQGTLALKTNPNNGDTYYFMGAAYYGKDQELKAEAPGYADSSEMFLTKAYEAFNQAKKLAPGAWAKSADDNIVSMYGRHFNRGVIASKKKDWPPAALEYRLATVADPENYQGYYAHAQALVQLVPDAKAKGEDEWTKLSDAIIKDLDRVLALKPTEKEVLISVYQIKGEMLYRRGDKKGAQENYSQAVALDPENYELMFTMADRFYNDQDWAGAVDYFSKALGIKERLKLVAASDADAYSALGSAYSKLAKGEESVAAFKRAMELKPDDKTTMYNIMVIYYRAAEAAQKDGKPDEVRDNCRECIKLGDKLIGLDPSAAEYWQVRGLCKRGIGDTAGAASDLKQYKDRAH